MYRETKAAFLSVLLEGCLDFLQLPANLAVSDLQRLLNQEKMIQILLQQLLNDVLLVVREVTAIGTHSIYSFTYFSNIFFVASIIIVSQVTLYEITLIVNSSSSINKLLGTF